MTSAFLDNVTTVLLLTPMLLYIAKVMNLNPIPFLLTMILASNVGGAGTLIGDPPNIMIASSSGLTFNEFILTMGPIAVVDLIIIIGIFYLIYGRGLKVDEHERQAMIKTLDTHPRRTRRHPGHGALQEIDHHHLSRDHPLLPAQQHRPDPPPDIPVRGLCNDARARGGSAPRDDPCETEKCGCSLFFRTRREDGKALAFNFCVQSDMCDRIMDHEKQIWRDMKKSINEEMAGMLHHCNSMDVPCTTKIVEGDRKEAIVEEANSGEYDLVVMGAYGRDAKTEIGSLFTAIIREITPPLIIVH